MLWAGIVFGGVSASVCASVCTKSRKQLIRNLCNLVGICPMVTLRAIFVFFSAQAIPLWWLDLATSFRCGNTSLEYVGPSFKVKATVAKNSRMHVCAPLRHSLKVKIKVSV